MTIARCTTTRTSQTRTGTGRDACDTIDDREAEADTVVEEDAEAGEIEERESGETEEGDADEGAEPAGGSASDPWSAYVYVDDPYVCFSSEGFRAPYDAADAYAVGYGTGLGWTLSGDFLVGPDEVADGYVCVDTSFWEYDDYELTLLSSLRSDGSAATTYLNTGDWWDNYDFCTGSSDASLAFCVSEGGYDYLVGITKTTSGLFPNGDGR